MFVILSPFFWQLYCLSFFDLRLVITPLKCLQTFTKPFQITDFCDDRHDYAHNHFGHNIEAPNQHNRLCSHRSTWNVIENTDDFRDGKNPPRDISNLAPTFKVVKAARQKRATLYLVSSYKIFVNHRKYCKL
jgi:hypothetical protein